MSYHGLDRTFEAVGPHFNGNPYGLEKDKLYQHGVEIEIDAPRTFNGIKDYLERTYVEGIVFWLGNEPVCKIKRSDFGYKWPLYNKEILEVIYNV